MNEKISVGNISVTLFEANHCPGKKDLSYYVFISTSVFAIDTKCSINAFSVLF